MSDDPIEDLNEALAGRYRVERELGQGGMATVYLAHDLRHDRKVALKVLKPELAAVVGSNRFLAEIKTTANLQHPHILPLYDSGEVNGLLFYVMPYVRGESLRKRLTREHQLPIEDAVRIATNMAEAIDYAHRQGVIHRDIKPANVLLQDGKPVISDFGIALALGSASGTRLTETGLSLGTPQYMSPEQATHDQNIGPATDVYALGCVLFEMLVGTPPFTGSTPQAVLGKIVTGETPSARAERALIPANVDAAIRRALEKVPGDRFQTANAFQRALNREGFRHGAGDEDTKTVPRNPGFWRPLAITAAVVALLAAAVALPMVSERTSNPPEYQRFPSPFLDGQEPRSLRSNAFGIAPDGSALVYRAQGDPPWEAPLMVREWSQLEATPIPGTEGGTLPSISPDGSQLAFVRRGEIHVIPVAGGTVTQVAQGSFPLWRSADQLYGQGPDGLIVRTAADGNSPQVITTADDDDRAHFPMDFIPGTSMGLMSAYMPDGTGLYEIRAFDPVSGEMTRLLPGDYPTYVAPGYIVYLLEDSRLLMAAPFDPEALEVTGPSTVLFENVIGYTLSDDGTLFYTTNESSGGSDFELVWVDRQGQAEPVDPGWTFDPGANTVSRGWTVSPDGQRIAMMIRTDQGSDIWIKPLPSGPPSRLTLFNGVDRFPRWSPDGQHVTFLSSRGGDTDMWSLRMDGAGDATLVLDTDGIINEAFWGPSGEWVIFRGPRDIWGARPAVDDELIPLIVTEFDETAPALSPDGRWLAYQSNESGRREVYVRSFPDTDGAKVLISASGGRAPLWAKNGRELFYVRADGNLMVADVDPGPPYRVQDRRILFQIPEGVYIHQHTATYDISPDDERFLMARTPLDEEVGYGVLVRGFHEELRRLVPR